MLVFSFGAIGISPINAQGLALSERLMIQLTKPMQVIVDGKSLRDAINAVGQQTQINLWLDRRVDPSVAVKLGPIGPTPFAALQQLAHSCGCVVMPIDNVMLIGRQRWVDQTAATLMSIDLDDSTPTVDIAWDDLTTPREALGKAIGEDFELENPLPHDLWPAVSWRRIDRRLAVALVLSQFDRRPVSTDSLTRVATTPMTDRGQFNRKYKLSELNDDFRKAFDRNSRTNQTKLEGDIVSASGRVSVHRTALASVLASVEPKSPDIDQATFTIKKMRTSAKNAFEQLAKMAGRTCRIESDVEQVCQNVVSVEGTDLTLRDLIARVASEAGVAATWTGDTIVISAAKRTGE
jgi:hypothetical protein